MSTRYDPLLLNCIKQILLTVLNNIYETICTVHSANTELFVIEGYVSTLYNPWYVPTFFWDCTDYAWKKLFMALAKYLFVHNTHQGRKCLGIVLNLLYLDVD